MLTIARAALLLVMLVCAAGRARAQDEQSNPTAIFFELGGNAVLYSLNVDQPVLPHVSVRAGIMVVPDVFSGRGGAITAAPLMINYLAGTRGHYLETGVGILFGADRTSDGTIDLVGGSSTTVTIGYRLQSGRRLFRAGFTPAFQMHRVEPLVLQGIHGPIVLRSGGRPLLPMFGVTFGRTFGG